MSEKIKSRIGEELYNKILEAGLKPEEFDLINEGRHIPKERLNEVTGKLKATESKVASYEKQLEETKALLAGNEEFKGKYESLIEKYTVDLALKDKEILNTSKRYLAEQRLRDEGGKHVDYLLNDLDFDTLSLDGGKLLGLDPQVEALKVKRADMFTVIQTSTNTTNTNDPQGNNNGGDDDWEALLKNL